MFYEYISSLELAILEKYTLYCNINGKVQTKSCIYKALRYTPL